MARSSPEKLAAALRANLKRRKEGPGDPPAGPPEPPPSAGPAESLHSPVEPLPKPRQD
jgi:hypothetical protein